MTPGFYEQEVVALARALIGCTLLVDGIGGAIVETEAYRADDPASHSFAGRTARNAAMWGDRPQAYVYRIYGAHWCFNVVGESEPGAAVLVRALEPLAGLEAMAARRGTTEPRLFCAGPGRLAQALGITGAMTGMPLDEAPFALLPREAGPGAEPGILAGPRIGITKAADLPWRFGLAGSRYLSRPFR